jgi:hypothetical protein
METTSITPAISSAKAATRQTWNRRVAVLGVVAVAAMGILAQPASARAVVYLGAPVYVYPPPAVVYAPRPVYVAPAPVYVAPPAPVIAAPAPVCHPYRTTVTVGGVARQVSGTACRQPDGSWRVVG